MKKTYKVAIWLWILFLVSFTVSGIMAILKNSGKLPTINPYFYLIGPVSYFIGALAFITTSRAFKYTDDWNDPKKGSILQLIGSILNALAFWLLVMAIVFLVGLVTGPPKLMWPRIITSTGATIIFVSGWLKIKRFKIIGLIPLLVFLSHVFQAFVNLLAAK